MSGRTPGDSEVAPDKFRMQFPPRHESAQPQKTQNINNQISNPEIPSRELHAKFLETTSPLHPQPYGATSPLPIGGIARHGGPTRR